MTTLEFDEMRRRHFTSLDYKVKNVRIKLPNRRCLRGLMFEVVDGAESAVACEELAHARFSETLHHEVVVPADKDLV